MNFITEIRTQLGLSQTNFADLLNVGRVHLALAETNQRALNNNSLVFLIEIKKKLDLMNVDQISNEAFETEHRIEKDEILQSKIAKQLRKLNHYKNVFEENQEKLVEKLSAIKNRLSLAKILEEENLLIAKSVSEISLKLIKRKAKQEYIKIKREFVMIKFKLETVKFSLEKINNFDATE